MTLWVRLWHFCCYMCRTHTLHSTLYTHCMTTKSSVFFFVWAEPVAISPLLFIVSIRRSSSLEETRTPFFPFFSFFLSFLLSWVTLAGVSLLTLKRDQLQRRKPHSSFFVFVSFTKSAWTKRMMCEMWVCVHACAHKVRSTISLFYNFWWINCVFIERWRADVRFHFVRH